MEKYVQKRENMVAQGMVSLNKVFVKNIETKEDKMYQ